MNKLSGEVAKIVEEQVRGIATTLPSADAELRRIFHGPPLRYMQPALDVLALDGGVECKVGDGTTVIVPVLLPVDPAPPQMPAIGSSGVCDREYLIELRNTPAAKRWIALTPPSAHDAMSVTGATDEFGLTARNNSRSSTIAEWFDDHFISRLVSTALDRNPWEADTHKAAARAMLESAARDADFASNHEASREGAWAALSRVFSITKAAGSFSQEWSLACGVPPMGGEAVNAPDQLRALNLLADALVESPTGFGGCADRLKRNASESDLPLIDEMISHIRATAGSPLKFASAPQVYYAPKLGDEVETPPYWWLTLTAEKISELLEEQVSKPETVRIRCDNAICGGDSGLPYVTQHAVGLTVDPPHDATGTHEVVVQREGLGRGNLERWDVDLPAVILDAAPPDHRQPIRYTATASGLKKSTLRVVALDSFLPGLVVTGRTIAKVSLPREAKGKVGHQYECQISLRGEGRHFLDIYLASNATLGGEAKGEDATVVGAAPMLSPTVPPLDGGGNIWGLEVIATAESYYEFEVINGARKYTVRLDLSAEDAPPEGVHSEFERLIRLNTDRAKGTLEVQVDRQVRVSDLQSWLLESARDGQLPYPLVIGQDCESAWNKPQWKAGAGSVLSLSKYIHDPRPPVDDFTPPAVLTQLRSEIAKRILGEDEHGLFESAELGLWLGEEGTAELIDGYVRAYYEWLEVSPESAVWADLVAVASVDGDGTLAQVPVALLVTPLHPLRIGWHALAQRTLLDSWRRGMPCPAASILDPDCIPDALTIPLRMPSGATNSVTYLSTECSSDYWSVLWSASEVGRLTSRRQVQPFGRDFGLLLGGVAGGFRVSQVKRALDDVSLLMSAKPTLNVLITSNAAQGNAATEGVTEWARDRFGAVEGEDVGRILGDRVLQVFDEREEWARPTPAAVANLLEDTGGATRWFSRTPPGARPDLGIIAQLETTNASADPTLAATPLGEGALIRHRIRSQLKAANGAFITESRMAIAPPASGDALSDHVAKLSARIENLNDTRLGFTFAPRVMAVQVLLKEKNAEYVAVSSSAVDPACFLGGWLEGAYLWDYELPAYSSRPGDTSGYYLLSKVKPLDCDALRDLLLQLPGCSALKQDDVQGILLEVARRGIPTVRGLAAGHSGAQGDLGLFLSGRLLQDEFRGQGHAPSLFPVIKSDSQTHEIVLVIPVDPFRGYLFELQRATKSESFHRPDLVVVAFSVTDSAIFCRITPVEVKYRQGSKFAGAAEALGQATSLSELLKSIRARGQESVLWKLAFQHLLLAVTDFAFRVYSQQSLVLQDPTLWNDLHQRVSAAILGDALALEVDPTGRLIIFDSIGGSAPEDVDSDGFSESVRISSADASLIARGSGEMLYATMRERLGDWRILPQAVGRVVGESLSQPLAPVVPPFPENEAEVDQELVPPSGGLKDEEPLAAGRAREAEHESTVETDVAESPKEPSVHEPGLPDTTLVAPVKHAPHPDGITVRIGTATDSFNASELLFHPSQTALNQLNIGVVGDLGTGKTQLTKSLIYQISRSRDENQGVKPRFLILDYKKDYGSHEFVEATKAKVISPRNLPINLFDTTGVTGFPPWMPRFRFFADILDKIYGNVGPVQRHNLKAAVKAAYEAATKDARVSTLYDVQQEYEAIVKGKPDAPLSIISDMTEMELFTRDPVAGASFEGLFDGVVVLSLAELGQDDKTKNLVVAIVLNMFYEFMLRLPKRPYIGTDPQLRTIDSYLLVDEADNIMRYEFDVLRTILLQGREFGVGVILASQYLKHFKAGATDYREPLLTWFIHKVPNVGAQDLSALGLTSNSAQIAERIKQLQNHQCLYKTYDVAGTVIRGKPFFELLKDDHQGLG